MNFCSESNRRSIPRLSRKAVLVLAFLLIAVDLTPVIAAPESTIVTCINLQTKHERISETGKCRITQEARANWHLLQSDSRLPEKDKSKTLVTCSNKPTSSVSYQIIRARCARHQLRSEFYRSNLLVPAPKITNVVAIGHNAAQIYIASDPYANPDAPVAYYTITSSKGQVKDVYTWGELKLTIDTLSELTDYSFTVSATTVDGTSPLSLPSDSVKTAKYVAPPAPAFAAAPIAAPAFTISLASENVTVGNAIDGYSVSSTGGAISSYSISPSAPAGLTFNTSTGLLSGSPTSVTSATTYTITANSASGSATRNFVLTVSAAITVGSTGPAGGKVFYVATTPFVCGPTMSTTCKYLEAAPSGWNSGSDPRRTWAQGSPVNYQSTRVSNVSSPETATAIAIGWGSRNTLAIIAQGNSNTGSAAAALAHSYSSTVSGNSFSDWYLPTKNELNQLFLQRAIVEGLASTPESYYWTSSEYSSASSAWVQDFFDGWQGSGGKPDSWLIRPIRAF